MSTTKDAALDQLLLGLSAGAEAKDDEAWVKRVASRAGPFAGTAALSRSELDALLVAPFPDEAADGDFDHGHGARDDHAAHAADHHGGDWEAASIGAPIASGATGRSSSPTPLLKGQAPPSGSPRVGSAANVRMEESMSEEEAPKKNDLEALAGLTRSSLAAPAPGGLGEIDGAAKADDSGRIDLRAMMGGGEVSNDADGGVAAAAAAGKPDDNVIDIGAIQRASAAPKRVSGPPAAAAGAPLSAAPSTTAPLAGAAATSATAPAKPADKKGGGLWIGLGLAAAAAVGIGVIAFSGSKKSDETASAAKQPAASVAADNKKEEKASPVVASATATAQPAADPAASASAAPDLVAKNDPKMAGTVAPAGTGNGAAPPGKAAPGAAPSASTKPTATVDPIHKPSGGSLDDVLGIGKDDPSKKTVATPDSNLPEKPDSGDIRSAVLGKQGAAQSCVKGLDGDSSVAVTFGPAGNVTAVVVTSGPAKGTGAETCIKNAFNGAKVPASKKGGTGYAKLLP